MKALKSIGSKPSRAALAVALLCPCVLLATMLPDSTSERNAAFAPTTEAATRLLSDSSAQKAPEKKISIGGAFLRSAVIPGWGQKTVGARTSARNFFVADVVLWLGVISFNVYGNWQKDDYHLLAAEYAQVAVEGKNDKFFVDVGNYNSVDDYNQSRLQRRDVAALYDPATHFWRWDSEANRERFDEIRLRSEQSYNNGELVIAAIIANHIISGIHAAWLANRHNSRLENSQPGAAYAPELGVTTRRDEIRLTAQWRF